MLFFKIEFLTIIKTQGKKTSILVFNIPYLWFMTYTVLGSQI